MKYRIQTNGEKFRVQSKILFWWIVDEYWDDNTCRSIELGFDTKRRAEHYIATETAKRTKQKRSQTWTVVE